MAGLLNHYYLRERANIKIKPTDVQTLDWTSNKLSIIHKLKMVLCSNHILNLQSLVRKENVI